MLSATELRPGAPTVPVIVITQGFRADGICELWELSIWFEFDTEEFQLVDYEYTEIDESKDLLICASFEKGGFFEGDIETEEFDITKLKITIDEEIGIEEYYFGDIVAGVYYDDEEVDNYGGSTNGKSFDVTKNF